VKREPATFLRWGFAWAMSGAEMKTSTLWEASSDSLSVKSTEGVS
jgi:hypothetical protein